MLTINDYKQILTYYKKSIPSNKQHLIRDAEKILSTKLCRCINKLGKQNEKRAIGICTKTIFNRKGYSRGKFTCKHTTTVKFRKTSKSSTTKRRKY